MLEKGGALEGVREWVEHWTRGWRARLERVEQWRRGWRARVGRGLGRVEHCRG